MIVQRAYKYDEHGFFLIDLVNFDPQQNPGVLYTETPVPRGLKFPRFHNGEWVNGNAVVEVIDRAWEVDEHGYFVVDLMNYDTSRWGQVYFTYVPCPSGVFHRPKFEFGLRQWVEGHEETEGEALEQARVAKKAAIDAWRAAKIAGGFPYEFDGVADVVQTRDTDDWLNINGRFLQAMQLINNGMADSALTFRAESNTTYTLTAAQMFAMANAAAAWREDIYAQAWAAVDAVKSATTIADLEAINLPV